MSAALTPEDLERLRVPLNRLPGFDAVGLHVWHSRTSAVESLHVGGDMGVVIGPNVALLDVPATVCIDAADASTRDRLARWVAERSGMQIGSTAPVLRVGELTLGGCFLELSSYLPLEEGRFTTKSRRWIARNPGRLLDPGECVPALFAFDEGQDPRLLPDGSRWVEAAALAAVAVHLGGQP